MEIPKQYDPKEAEQHHYERWERNGYFAPEINKDPGAPVFTIVIPPPNVTGSLHMGHALQHTLMDVMTRSERNGYFAPEINKDPGAPVFTIVIPPPNVTGSLHMGHALQHTLMDVMTRHKRM